MLRKNRPVAPDPDDAPLRLSVSNPRKYEMAWARGGPAVLWVRDSRVEYKVADHHEVWVVLRPTPPAYYPEWGHESHWNQMTADQIGFKKAHAMAKAIAAQPGKAMQDALWAAFCAGDFDEVLEDLVARPYAVEHNERWAAVCMGRYEPPAATDAPPEDP